MKQIYEKIEKLVETSNDLNTLKNNILKIIEENKKPKLKVGETVYYFNETFPNEFWMGEIENIENKYVMLYMVEAFDDYFTYNENTNLFYAEVGHNEDSGHGFGTYIMSNDEDLMIAKYRETINEKIKNAQKEINEYKKLLK